MNHKFNVILLAGGFGTTFQMIYPSVPKALIPLGHNPCICILIETLLELQDIENIHVLAFERHVDRFKKEINRWFFNHNRITITSLPDTPGTAKSIEYFLTKKMIKSPNILLLHSNMPLISKNTIRDLMAHFLEQGNDIMCLVSKLKNTENDTVVLENNETIVRIISGSKDSESSSDFCFLNTMAIKLDVLEKNLPKIVCHPETNEYNITDIVKHNESKSGIYMLNPYMANKECIMIRKVDDKNFAEETYMEHRNAMFIHQCYGLWKKCEIFENRLQFLESVIERNKLL
jgi:hypothetical protein